MGSILVRCVAGPDAGWSQPLSSGSHWIGRAPGGLCVLDPAIEAHLARVDVAEDGSASMLQTSGRAPVLVGGAPAEGWVRLTDGTTLEFGGTRLELGATADAPCAAVGWVYEPQDTSAAELARFERDVRLAAAASRRRALDGDPAGTVEIGIAEIRAPVEVRAADGSTRLAGSLSHAAQAVLDRASSATGPLRIALPPGEPVAVVAADPEPIVASLVNQLDPASRALVVVVAADEADELEATGRPILVTATDADDVMTVMTSCRALLSVGTTWRGIWQPDLREHPDHIVHLHARGHSPRRSSCV